MLSELVSNNVSTVSVVLFLGLFAAINVLKPALMYDKDGSIRQFGINSTKKTVLPVWLMSISLAIITYLGVSYYVKVA
jgi:hypothetical protein